MDNNDIDTIISLFKERGNPSNFLINKSEPDKFQPILDRFPVFEIYNCFSFSMSLKQGKSFKKLLKDNQYTEKFSAEELMLILNSEITPTSAFIIFYNILSFLFYSDDSHIKKSNSDLPNSMENEMTIEIFILFMKCLISLTHLQFQKTKKSNSNADDQKLNTMNGEPVLPPSFYNRQIFFFFKKIFASSLHFFNENDKSADENQIKEAALLILAFFDTQRKLPAQFFDLFISFIFKFKVQEFYEQILNLLLKLLNEKRLLILHCDVSKLIEYINPYLLEFNQRALDIIVAISLTYQPLSKSVIDSFSNLSLSLINKILSSSPKIIIENEGEKVDLPYNVDDQSLNRNSTNFELIKEISLNFYETESRFEKGFIRPDFSTKGINWLLGKLDKNIIEIIAKFLVSFMHSNDDFIDNFFYTFETAISKINQIYCFDALTIFYHFATNFQDKSFISKYFNFILDPNIFNEKETIFTSLSEEKNAFRNAAFEILSNFPETISAFIVKSLNPLFRSELILRIQDLSSYYIIIQDVANVCLSLRNIDMKWHCEAIEKARCSSFCFLSELFLSMFNSYEYFGAIMQFCMEKTITNIFINLYKESTITLRNFELLQKVFDFIYKILNISLEISWKLIKITDSIFEKRDYLIIQMKNFFILIMNYILKLKTESASNPSLLNEINDIEKRSFKAVRMSLKYISLFDIINSKYLHEITKHLSNNMSEELFMELLIKMGKSPKLCKIDFFVIKYPIFIPIILFSCGLTEQIIVILTNLCNFSIKNICYMHDQQVDSVFIQILQGKKRIKYRNEIFDNFYYDISIPAIEIKNLLFTICSYKTDYRIVSKFLMDKTFIPFVYSLLSNYQNNKLPILNIPTMTAESRVPLDSSHFLNNFSISFWLMIDINYLLIYPNENIDLITIQNGIYRFGIYIQGSKLRAYYANGTRRSDVTLIFLNTSKCMWNFIETSYICKKKIMQTFYKELPINESEFGEVLFNDENPITIKINSHIQKRVYNPKNNSYLSFYSFKKNEFIGFIKDVSFYDRKLNVKEILDLFNRSNNNDIISVASLSRTGDFNVYYKHYDNLFDVLKRGTTVIKLTEILLEPCQKENICYCILNILGFLADSIDIPFASLLIFVNDENHFKFKGVFNCFYSIFENIKTNQSSKIKFFTAFISNVQIWSNYINFRKILYFYQTKLIIRNFDLLINNSSLNLFLYHFDLIDSKYWDDYLFFLKRFLEKMVQNDGTNEHISIAILSCINIKYNSIKKSSENLINNQQNLSYIILEQSKIETSNIIAFYPSIFQAESENKKDETSIFKTKKIAEIHPNKLATFSSRKEKKKLKESKKFDVVPKNKQFDIFNDIPDEFKDNLMAQTESDSKQIKNITINNEIQNVNDDNDNLSDENRMYILYMLDLINYKSSIFSNNKDAILILFQLLKLKDLQITKQVLISLYKISSEQSISAFTLISYNNINKEFFKSIFEFLTEKINEFPNFFPLTCILAYSIKPQPDCFEFFKNFNSLEMTMKPEIINNNDNNNIFNFLSNSNNNNFKIEFDPWYLFPIILSFTLNDESLILLFKILVQNSKREQKTIERMIVLFHFMTNYYENKIILARFLEYLYNFYNEFICEIIKYLAMILFTHPYLENNSDLTLLHLINNESLISKSIEYEIGMHFYQNKKWNNSFQILMKLLDFLPECQDESTIQIILSLNSIFKGEIHSSNSFYEMSITCEQLIKDYKLIFEENFNDIFSVLRYILQSNNDITKIEKSKHYKKIINENKNNFEIINNQVDYIFKKRKRLSSQFDPIFRQMIYRIDEKLPKDLIIPDINCFLFNNNSESDANIGIHYEQKGSKVSISTPTSERYFDIYNDVNFAFKRKDDEVFEIFTKFGKKYRLQFFGKHQKREIARSNINVKIFDDFVKKWTQSEITNFEFLMILNAYADNIHQDRAIFPSPLYKNKVIPDGNWSLMTTNNGASNEDKKTFVFKTKRLSLMPNFRLTVNQSPKKRRISLLNTENKNSPKKSNLFDNFKNKSNQENSENEKDSLIDKNSTISNHKSDSIDNNNKENNNENEIDKNEKDSLIDKNSTISNHKSDSVDNDNKENNNENEINKNEKDNTIDKNSAINMHKSDSIDNDNKENNNEKENEIDSVSANKEVIDLCIENPVVPARYFYDFEIYAEENNDTNQPLDDLNNSIDTNQKNKFELLYNMRKCIENCTNIEDFSNEYLSIQIRKSRKLIEEKNFPGIIQNESTGSIIFAASINSYSCSECPSFIAINSNFYVKYFSCTKVAETNLFLLNLNQTETSQPKHTMLHEGSLPSFLVSNDISLSSSVQSLTLNEADSFVLNNVSNKSRLFQIDDGIAAFDPNNKILVIFTTSSIDSISTAPSPLSLTSLNPFYAKNFDSSVLVPLIFATSIPEVRVKTYATAMSDSIDLLCGNSERQFYVVSPTVVYSNSCFFAQFSSAIKILRVSFDFNILIAATEDGKVHIRSSTSGKKVTTINGFSENDEIDEILITKNFGFVAVFLKSGMFNLFTINGTLIKSFSFEKQYDINFWFTFDSVKGIDYVGFVTNNDRIFYFEAFYPSMLVEMKGNEIFKNILSINYDKFSKCFLVLNANGEIYFVSHDAFVAPINYNLI